ncbi:MAG: protein-L-isoaspartate O-methyltransferase [Nanoarchaeota archaeon]|nr:protein-L-isoaspartate O-methyltransferase [Nanoarchaeota archaeon]
MQLQKEKLLQSLRANKFSDNIIEAFSAVPREKFVPEEFAVNSYDDLALPLNEVGSTLSQPSVIAIMLQLLEVKEEDKILEIGSGCGYVLSLLSHLAKKGEIYGVEINTRLAADSIKTLEGDKKIKVFNTDGSLGLPSHAPYDRILISASAQDLTTVYQILDQLKDPGIMVAPVKDSLFQIKKINKKLEKHEFPGFLFVPLVKSNP